MWNQDNDIWDYYERSDAGKLKTKKETGKKQCTVCNQMYRKLYVGLCYKCKRKRNMSEIMARRKINHPDHHTNYPKGLFRIAVKTWGEQSE